MTLDYIDFDRAEHNICRNCVDELRGRGKSETLDKVRDRTVYGMDESEEYKEEVEGTVVGGGGDEVSVMLVFYPPCGTVSVSPLSIFRLLVHHINLLILPFLSLLEYTVFNSISIIRGGGSENESSHMRRRPGASGR